MVISSAGYAGTVNALQWARMKPYVGKSTYGVVGVASWRVSAAGGTRQVQVSTGTGFGRGIFDVSDSVVTLPSAPAVPSGDRWDLVAARRVWGTKTTQFVWVQGGSAKAIPATRKQNPGVEDDQPLYLVRFRSGQSTPQEFVDVRCLVGDGGLYINDLAARGYLGEVGTTLWLGDDLWRVRLEGSNRVWSRERMGDSGLVRSGLDIAYGGRFNTAGYALSKVGRNVKGYLGVQHKTESSISIVKTDKDGNFSSPIAVCRFRTASWKPETFGHVMITRGQQIFHGYIDPPAGNDEGGLVTLEVGPPNTELVRGAGYRVYLDYFTA